MSDPKQTIRVVQGEKGEKTFMVVFPPGTEFIFYGDYYQGQLEKPVFVEIEEDAISKVE